jgi:CHAT domain-containing protein
VAERIASRPYRVVHLASHGVVEGDVAESYLLTHDGRIELEELSAYVATRRFGEEPIELLTLSARETATGDERATLGLSGPPARPTQPPGEGAPHAPSGPARSLSRDRR